MKNKLIDPDNGEPINYKALTDVETQKRIEQHMSDINDVITEQDLQNIRTDMYDELLKPVGDEKQDEDNDGGETIPVVPEQTIADKEKEKKESEKISSAWNIMED